MPGASARKGGKGIGGDMGKARASPAAGMRATQEEQGRKSQGAWVFSAIPGWLHLDCQKKSPPLQMGHPGSLCVLVTYIES